VADTFGHVQRKFEVKEF